MSKNKISKKITSIVCLGDSITCNWDSPSYPEYWQQQITQDKHNIKIINSGINGETAQDGYYRLQTDVIAYNPDLITIMFGHNELGKGLPLSHFESYLNLIISNIKHHLPRALIWVLTPNKINHTQQAKKYQSLLKLLRQPDPRFSLIDIWGIFPVRDLDSIYTYKFDYGGQTGTDYLHPNAKGQQIIARHLHQHLIDMSI